MLKIVSWNIMQGGGWRADAIVDQLVEWKADVVCLLEFCDNANSNQIAERLQTLGLGHQALAQTSEKYRVFVASRIPFEVVAPNEIYPEIGRSLVVKLQGEKALLLLAVHVPNRRELGNVKYKFHEAVVRFMDKYASEDAIVIGDTNTGQKEIDEESSYFNKREHGWFGSIAKAGWIDSWRKRNPETREFTFQFRSGKRFRIDQAFASQSADIRIKKIQYRQPIKIGEKGNRISDHAAIVLEIASE